MTLAAATAAVATVLAACGGSGSDSGPSAAPTEKPLHTTTLAGPNDWKDGGFRTDASALRCNGAAPDPTRGVTDSAIKIGGLAYLTSPNGSSMAGSDTGAKVRFQRANDEGGINGRRIDYIGTLDDGLDAARNTSQAKVLAEQEKVFAVVPEITSSANYLDVFCTDKVPFFGWAINSGFCGNTVGFGITGCLTSPDRPTTSSLYGVMIASMFGGDARGKTVALVGNDDDSGRNGIDDMRLQVQSVGAKVAYAENPIPGAGLTDTTPIVNKVMASAGGAPPDVLVYVTDFASTTKLVQAFNAAGFQGKHLTAVGYDPRLAAAKFAGLQKTYTLLQFAAAEDTSSAGIRQMIADFRKYAPDTPLSLPTIAGYFSADMFVDAATETGKDLTVDSFLKTLNSDYTYSSEGAVPQARYPLSHSVGTPCGEVVQLNGDTYSVTTKLGCGEVIVK